MPSNIQEYNHDELVTPTWLNADFIKEVLRESEKVDDIEVNNLKLTPGSEKGDHYASIMFRAVVHYKQLGEEKVKSMIIKILPDTDGHKKEFFAESHIFETEIGIYTELIPRFEEILRSFGDTTKLGARCIYYSLEPRQVIIFDDLCELGYRVLRDRQPNAEEIKLALLKLVKIQAISHKLLKEQPAIFEKYRHGVMTVPNIVREPYIHDGLENFIDLLDAVPELKKFKVYFERMRGKLVPACQKSYNEYNDEPQDDAFYALCHGDFHSKNMMFNYDDKSGELLDCMLLDFQMSYVGPVGNDVIYAFYMLFNKDLRLNQRDEFGFFHFSNFIKTLKMIEFKGNMPNFDDYKKQMMKHKHLDIFYLTTFFPLWCAFVSRTANMEETFSNAAYRKKLYQNEDYVSELKLLLPQLLDLGYFENLCFRKLKKKNK